MVAVSAPQPLDNRVIGIGHRTWPIRSSEQAAKGGDALISGQKEVGTTLALLIDRTRTGSIGTAMPGPNAMPQAASRGHRR
jgi:hypothetical protein